MAIQKLRKGLSPALQLPATPTDEDRYETRTFQMWGGERATGGAGCTPNWTILFFLKQGPPTDLPGSHTDLSTALGTVMKPGNSIEPRKNKKVRERQKQSGLRLV